MDVDYDKLFHFILILVLGWIVIMSWSYLFERFVLRKLKTFWAVFGVVIIISLFYISLALASNIFIFSSYII